MRDDSLSHPESRPVGMWLGHAFFVVYCAIAIVFYRERVLYDTAVFLNTGPLLNGTFFSALGRVTVQFPPQVLPLIAVKLGLSSQTAAMAYSLNFALFHYAAWVVVVHVFRRVDLGIALIVSVLLYLVHNNIYIQADVTHAMVYVYPFIALAEGRVGDDWRQKTLRIAVATLFGVAACFGHPLMLGMLLYFALYAMFVRKRNDVGLLFATGMSLLSYLLYKVCGIDSYESGAFVKTLQLSHLRESAGVLPSYLWNAHKLLIVFCAFLIMRVKLDLRNALVVLLSLVTALVLLGALCSWLPLTTHSNWQFSGYTWMYFLAVYFVLLVPLFDDNLVTPRELSWKLRPWIHATLILTAMVWAIAGTCLDFHLANERQKFIVRVRDSLADVKPPVYLLDQAFSMNPLIRENDLTFWDDSLLVTSYDGPDKACMLIPPSSWNNGMADQYRKHYLQPLNSKYFDIPFASLENAYAANRAVPLNNLNAAAMNLEIHFPETATRLSYRGGAPEDYHDPITIVHTATIVFENHASEPFPSRAYLDDAEGGAKCPVHVGYLWISGGRIVGGNRYAETLAIDVLKRYEQDIPVTRDGIPDDAKLFVGLFVTGKYVPCMNHRDLPGRRYVDSIVEPETHLP